jgi:hypothetical protein
MKNDNSKPEPCEHGEHSCLIRTAVHAEYTVLDDDGERQKVKHVRKIGPNVRGTIFSYAFRIEAVGLSDVRS